MKNELSARNTFLDSLKAICFFMLIQFGVGAFFILSLSITSFTAAIFKGKVIDADTKQPIEGAVVVASWLEERAAPTGSTSRLYDVKETLTDPNGKWSIEGPSGRDMGNISAIFTLLTGSYITNPPQFIIFKPGYCSWPKGFNIDRCKEKIRPEGDGRISEGKDVELPKLSRKEDRLTALPGPVAGQNALNKQIEFIRLINEESKFLGIPEAYR
jgi:hypothetical protein